MADLHGARRRGRFAGLTRRHGIIAARRSLRRRVSYLYETFTPTLRLDMKKGCNR